MFLPRPPRFWGEIWGPSPKNQICYTCLTNTLLFFEGKIFPWKKKFSQGEEMLGMEKFVEKKVYYPHYVAPVLSLKVGN